MKLKSFYTAVFLIINVCLCGQNSTALPHYVLSENIEVISHGKALKYPWVGGLNFVQIESFDFNADGIEDMLVFDRSGNKILPFVLQNGQYQYSDEYRQYLPEVQNWIKMIDYNCDGKKDLFAYNQLGIEVWTNISDGQNIRFQKEYFTYNTSGGQMQLDAVKTNTGGAFDVNLNIIYQDIPVIADVDQNGSVDILNFGIGSAIPEGSTVEFHENQSDCGLDFIRRSICWGGFAENYANNNVSLGVCNSQLAKTYSTQMHAGSSILLYDFNGDQLQDLLIGDITFNNATMLVNGGTSANPDMIDQDASFPSYSTPINLEYFPGFSMIDLFNDGSMDLIASPAIRGSQNTESVWHYQDQNQSGQSNFQLLNKDFLQGEMIDVGEASYPHLVDIDGDGLVDLMVSSFGKYTGGGNYSRTIHYYKNTGDGQRAKFELVDEDFGSFSQYSYLTNLYTSYGDLNGDGLVDIVVGDAQGLIHLYYASSFGNYYLQNFNLAGIDVGNFSSPYLYDINRDGLLDLIIGNKKGSISYYQNTGGPNNPNFELKSQQWGGIDLQNIDVQGAFLSIAITNHNGLELLLLGTQIGKTFSYLINNADNSIFELLSDDVAKSSEGERASVCVGDLNGDAIADLIIGNMSGGIRLFESSVDFWQEKSKITIYPNPVGRGEILRIKDLVLHSEQGINIYDLAGKSIKFSIKDGGIELSSMDVGVYIIRIENSQKHFSAKFIVY